MIIVITGPPCAGKTTYATQRAGRGDLIIDYDRIAGALGSPNEHAHPPAHARTAQAAWHAAVGAAVNAGAHAWIIHAQPGRRDLTQYRQWRARIVVLDPGESTVRQRAIDTGRPAATLTYIDQWYRKAHT